MKFLNQSTSEITYTARAVYYPQPDGSLKLARIQTCGKPVFREAGWEEQRERLPTAPDLDPDELNDLGVEARKPEDVRRAISRARRRAFDLIMCNPELDAFATLTYSPDSVDDKANYQACYKYLRTWLSNGVQRDGLAYVCVPELTKKGDIHFHAICNANALRLDEARSAKTGRLLKHNGDQVYNLRNWVAGFSTAQLIRQRADQEDARLAVSKYIFKYMTKQEGQKVGGRYMLTGGKLAVPVYVYADSAEELAPAAAMPAPFSRETPMGTYKEYVYLGNPKNS